MHHDLKTWPAAFQAIRLGLKKFEYRYNDRDFKVKDTIMLREYDPVKNQYTGRAHPAKIIYIIKGPAYGIPAGYCIFSFVKHNPVTHAKRKKLSAVDTDSGSATAGV